jgi:hypothetical protein
MQVYVQSVALYAHQSKAIVVLLDRASYCCRAAYVNIACLGEGQPRWYALQVNTTAVVAAVTVLCLHVQMTAATVLCSQLQLLFESPVC